MEARELTREQCKELQRQLAPTYRFLRRLYLRMDQKAFPQDDKLFRLVHTAYMSVHTLSTELHYMSCQGGVGRRQD